MRQELGDTFATELALEHCSSLFQSAKAAYTYLSLYNSQNKNGQSLIWPLRLYPKQEYDADDDEQRTKDE